MTSQRQRQQLSPPSRNCTEPLPVQLKDPIEMVMRVNPLSLSPSIEPRVYATSFQKEKREKGKHQKLKIAVYYSIVSDDAITTAFPPALYGLDCRRI